jgi:hypothetical protein
VMGTGESWSWGRSTSTGGSSSTGCRRRGRPSPPVGPPPVPAARVNQAVACTGPAPRRAARLPRRRRGRPAAGRDPGRGHQVDGVAVLADAPTGEAMVWVDDAGENCIVVVAGANDRMARGTGGQPPPGMELAPSVVLAQGETRWPSPPGLPRRRIGARTISTWRPPAPPPSAGRGHPQSSTRRSSRGSSARRASTSPQGPRVHRSRTARPTPARLASAPGGDRDLVPTGWWRCRPKGCRRRESCRGRRHDGSRRRVRRCAAAALARAVSCAATYATTEKSLVVQRPEQRRRCLGDRDRQGCRSAHFGSEFRARHRPTRSPWMMTSCPRGASSS